MKSSNDKYMDTLMMSIIEEGNGVYVLSNGKVVRVTIDDNISPEDVQIIPLEQHISVKWKKIRIWFGGYFRNKPYWTIEYPLAGYKDENVTKKTVMKYRRNNPTSHITYIDYNKYIK